MVGQVSPVLRCALTGLQFLEHRLDLAVVLRDDADETVGCSHARCPSLPIVGLLPTSAQAQTIHTAGPLGVPDGRKSTPRSVSVDEEDFDGVVSVAQPVPWRDVGLGVAGRVGGTGAEGMASDVVAVPDVRPP